MFVCGGCREKYNSPLAESTYHKLSRHDRSALADKIASIESNVRLPGALGLWCLLAAEHPLGVEEDPELGEAQLLRKSFRLSPSNFVRVLGSDEAADQVADAAYAEVLARFDDGRYKFEGDYPCEVPFGLVQGIEHLRWYADPVAFATVADLQRAADYGDLYPEDFWSCGVICRRLEGTPFRLADGIGKLDKPNRQLYRLAPAPVWDTMVVISDEMQRQGHHPDAGRYRIDSLTRCSSYPLKQGAKNSSHCFGGAFDIDLDSPSFDEKTYLHQALYALALRGQLAYYLEDNTAVAGKLQTLPTPYNFDDIRAGQVHVIVNPNWEEETS